MDFFISQLKLTFLQVFIIIVPGLFLAWLMNIVSGRVEVLLCTLMGRRAYLYLFGWLGTIVHELGHAVMCLILRHRIDKMKLFTLNPEAQYDGYVNHSYNPLSIYQFAGNFLIGIGPILFGSLIIYFSAYQLIPKAFKVPFDDEARVWESFRLLSANIFVAENIFQWEFWLFFYIFFSLSSCMKLSSRDIKGAKGGFLVFLIFLFLINAGVSHFDFRPLHPLPLLPVFFMCAAMVFALFLNGGLLGILYLARRN